MEVHFKITTWEKVIIPEGKENKVLELINNGEIETSEDIFLHIDSDGYEGVIHEIIDETEIQLTLEENEGFSTIKVLNDDDEIIYQNGLN